jgi:hypothetical protein
MTTQNIEATHRLLVTGAERPVLPTRFLGVSFLTRDKNEKETSRMKI